MARSTATTNLHCWLRVVCDPRDTAKLIIGNASALNFIPFRPGTRARSTRAVVRTPKSNNNRLWGRCAIVFGGGHRTQTDHGCVSAPGRSIFSSSAGWGGKFQLGHSALCNAPVNCLPGWGVICLLRLHQSSQRSTRSIETKTHFVSLWTRVRKGGGEERAEKDASSIPIPYALA